jgi:hypothetical protein
LGKECCKAGSEKDPKLFAGSGSLPSGPEFDPRLHKKVFLIRYSDISTGKI